MEAAANSTQVNLEAQKPILKTWNDFARDYDHYLQISTLQGLVTLAVHTRFTEKKRVLEVACGSGMHSLFLGKTMLQRGAALVSCDISDEMIKLFKGKFEDPQNDYSVIPGNRLVVKTEELAELGQKTWDLDEHLKQINF